MFLFHWLEPLKKGHLFSISTLKHICTGNLYGHPFVFRHFSKKRLISFSVRVQGFGYLIVLRRPDTPDVSPWDYIPCIHCKGYVVKSLLAKHEVKCKSNENHVKTGNPGLKRQGQYQVFADIGQHSEELKKFMASLRPGNDVTNIILEEPTLLATAQSMFDKKNMKDEARDQIKNQIRALGRLLQVMRRAPGNSERSMESFVRRKDFFFFLQCIVDICFEEKKHSLAMNMGWTVIFFDFSRF